MFAWTRKAYRAGALGLVLAGSLVILAAAPALSAAATYSLDQCTNGAVEPLTLEPCLGSNQTTSVEGFKNWVNGDANGTKAHWQEGDFVPYRVRISGIKAGTHRLEIHYDEVSSSKHAFDYLGSYDASETTSSTPTELHANKNNPCIDVVQTNEMAAAECNPTAVPAGHTSAIPIPTLEDCGESAGTGPALTSSPGNVVIFGPSGTSLGTVEYHEQNIPSGKGSCSTSVYINFTSPVIDSTHTIVIAWGGHIASEADWGAGNSAVAIHGSPYHMYVDGLDGTGGAVDHQLSTSAIVFRPSITTDIQNSLGVSLAGASIPVNTTVHDTATMTGATGNAGGTVTYNRFTTIDCTGTPTPQTVTVTNGIVPNSSDFTPTTAGSYSYQAVYSGSSGPPENLAAMSPCEPLTVMKVQPAISTTALSSVILGGSLHDTAHLTGGFNPTGMIAFTLYAAGDTTCKTALKTVQTEVNKGDGDYESPAVAPAVGGYQWVASYSGDANNLAATTSCNDPNEQASVGEHPGITALKEQQVAGSGAPFTSAALSATVGQQINYRITVTNTGDVALTLSFSDPHCDAGTITGPIGSLNPDGTLPPAGVVQYFCSHVLQASDGSQLVNVATVTGQPPSGPPVSATSSVTTNVTASVPTNVAKQVVVAAPPAPKQVVAAVCSISEGSIKLHGANGSKSGPFTVTISALGIKQITFYLDNRKLKTLTKAQAKNGQFTIKIDPRKLRFGAHTVSVKTVMSDANCAKLARAGVFVHPHPSVVKPKFTG
jgi:hypothetical protein